MGCSPSRSVPATPVYGDDTITSPLHNKLGNSNHILGNTLNFPAEGGGEGGRGEVEQNLQQVKAELQNMSQGEETRHNKPLNGILTDRRIFTENSPSRTGSGNDVIL